MRIDPSSFDATYSSADDPWNFASSPYELARYAQTMSSLGSERYERCFEPACSIGVLTAMLAERSDEVVGCDGSAVAIGRARQRLADLTNVRLVAGALPDWWPDGSFDLIVLSELGYYWDADGWGDMIDRFTGSLADGGEIVAVHWLGSSPDHVTNGRDVHSELGRRLGPADLHIEPPGAAPPSESFVLDRWSDIARRDAT